MIRKTRLFPFTKAIGTFRLDEGSSFVEIGYASGGALED